MKQIETLDKQRGRQHRREGKRGGEGEPKRVSGAPIYLFFITSQGKQGLKHGLCSGNEWLLVGVPENEEDVQLQQAA